jgi:hypothetical protein
MRSRAQSTACRYGSAAGARSPQRWPNAAPPGPASAGTREASGGIARAEVSMVDLSRACCPLGPERPTRARGGLGRARPGSTDASQGRAQATLRTSGECLRFGHQDRRVRSHRTSPALARHIASSNRKPRTGRRNTPHRRGTRWSNRRGLSGGRAARRAGSLIHPCYTYGGTATLDGSSR